MIENLNHYQAPEKRKKSQKGLINLLAEGLFVKLVVNVEIFNPTRSSETPTRFKLV